MGSTETGTEGWNGTLGQGTGTGIKDRVQGWNTRVGHTGMGHTGTGYRDGHRHLASAPGLWGWLIPFPGLWGCPGRADPLRYGVPSPATERSVRP